MSACSDTIAAAVADDFSDQASSSSPFDISVTPSAPSVVVAGLLAAGTGMSLSGVTPLVDVADTGHETAAFGWAATGSPVTASASYTPSGSLQAAAIAAIPTGGTSPVQSKSVGWSWTPIATLDSPPTAGNLLVAIIMNSQSGSPATLAISGWTRLAEGQANGIHPFGGNSVGIYARCSDGADGSIATATSTYSMITLMEWAGPSPTVDFTGDPLFGSAPLSVDFTGSAEGMTPTSWDWDFGDGSAHGSGSAPTHVYSTPGVYTVSLSATDGVDTATRTRTAYVFVRGPGIGLDVYRVDPPGTSLTYLATLDGAFDRFIRPERNAVGSGGFKIRRDDPQATDSILAQGNLVKATFPEIDPGPIFAFFIQSRETVVVSPDESGGEILQVGGRGALDYFDWARWLAVSYVVPWWSDGWADLVDSAPPAGSLGHIAVAAGTYNRFTFNSDGTVVYPPTTFTTGGFSAFYDRRRVRKYESGAPLAGKDVTLVRLSTGSHAGWWLHPMDAGFTDVRSSSILGLRPEFGDIGKSAVTQWWDSGWGTPPAGTLGRVSLAAGTYREYTVSGGRITGRSTFTTGGMSAWYDSRRSYPFAGSKSRATLVQLSSGTKDNAYIHPMDHGIREWQASEPVVSLVPGKVLWRICQEVQAALRPSHPMPLLTYDFDETTDSDGNDWTVTDSLAGISAEVGDSLADSIAKVLATGVVDVEMGPDLDFHAWNERGRDLSGASFGAGVVRFAKGVNIAAELKRESADGPPPTYTQVVGPDGWASAELEDAADRVARETTTRVEADDDVDSLEAAGLADLELRLSRSDSAGFQVDVGDDEAKGLYYPGPPWSANGRWWLGDWVTVHTGDGADDFDEVTMRVAALTISETESGDLVVIVEVGSSLGAAEDAAFPGPAGSGPGVGSAAGGSAAAPSGSGSGSGGGTGAPDLSGYQQLAERGIAGGYAPLDSGALVPAARLPDVEALRTSEADTSLVLSPDGYGGLAFAAAPSGGLPWFDVTDYGAVHDGSTDDTPAIQGAIDAAEAAGGGVVFFPRGVYAVSGALRDTGRSNAQILLPRRHVTDGTEQLTVHLLGESAPPAIPYISGSSTEPEGGSVLKSTLSSGTGAVVGAWGPSGSYLDFSLVRVGVKNLCVRTVADPTISGLDLSHVEAVELADVMVDAGEYTMGSISQQTTSTSYGIKLPGNNNGASTFLRGVVNVVGFYNGVLVGEHTVADNVQVWAARKAYVFPAAYHASHFSRMAYYHCQRGLVGSASRHYLTVSQLDLEHAASGTWAPVYDVDDASDYLYGHLAWHVILEVTGYDSTFTVNGASNLHRIEIGSNPFGGPSFATPSIAYGTPAAGSSGDAVQSDATIPRPTAADVDFSSDVTTSNATTGHHGLLPKLDGNAAHYLDGTGAFSTPSGSGGGQYRAWLFSASGGTLTILTAVDGTPLTGLMDLE